MDCHDSQEYLVTSEEKALMEQITKTMHDAARRLLKHRPRKFTIHEKETIDDEKAINS
jgi:hypothetical protein